MNIQIRFLTWSFACAFHFHFAIHISNVILLSTFCHDCVLFRAIDCAPAPTFACGREQKDLCKKQIYSITQVAVYHYHFINAKHMYSQVNSGELRKCAHLSHPFLLVSMYVVNKHFSTFLFLCHFTFIL